MLAGAGGADTTRWMEGAMVGGGAVYRDDALADALAEYKRSIAALIGMVGVVVGLAFGFGLGVGAGYHLNALERLGGKALADLGKPVMSKREQFRLCSLSLTEAEANPVPSNEELEQIAVRWRARYAEPKWGTP